MARQRVVERQKQIIDELRRFGAECDAVFDKAACVRIQLGKKWRGGAETVSLLRQLERVDELTLVGNSIDDTVLKQLVSLPHLTIVRIQQTAITRAGLARLRRVKGIVGLELRQSQLPVSVWDDICELNLMWLHVELDSPPLGDNNPMPGQLDRLFSLRISGQRISDKTLCRVCLLGELRALVLAKTRISDASLNQLAKLTKLSHLDLSRTNVQGSGLTSLCKLKSMRELVLSHTSISDDVIPYLAHMEFLESLTLDGTEVTDPGVARLASLQELRTVSLIGTPTTLTCLDSFSKNKSLITVVDYDGGVTLFQPRWLKSWSGKNLPYWVKCRSKKLFLWTEKGRQLYQEPILPKGNP